MQRNEAVRVSVIVPCRNEIRHIEAFLDCLRRQDLGRIEMEVLIADGMSFDGTRRVLQEFERRFPASKIIDNPEKLTSAGLNRAIEKALGEIIIRMDVHTIYAPDYIRSCVQVLQETSADNVGGPALTRADGYTQQTIALAFHAPFACGGAKFHDPQYQGPVDTVTYGCWRLCTLERIGLFDEELIRGEDNELNLRLISNGGTVWQSPRIVSWYQPRSTLADLFWQYFQNGYWKVAVVRKYGRPPSWRNVVPGLSLFIAMILLAGAAGASLEGSSSQEVAFLEALLAMSALYLTASFTSAFKVARQKGWIFLPFLPIVFATYHLSYALGFCLGVFWRPATSDATAPVRKVSAAGTK